MDFFKFLFLTLFTLHSARSSENLQKNLDSPFSGSNLAVSVSASFPSSDILGIRIFNDQKTNVELEFTNNEASPVIISSIKGALSSLQSPSVDIQPSSGIVRNLTTTRYNIAVPAGGKQSVLYIFTTDIHPQDLHLNIVAFLSYQEDSSYLLQAFNQTVTIVDPVASIFDPQILFLYTILLSIAAGTTYWVYKTWIQNLFQQNKRRTRNSDHAKRSYQSPKAAKSSGQETNTISSTNESAVISGISGQKTYDESWIPDHHIKKAAMKRPKTGNNKKKSTD